MTPDSNPSAALKVAPCTECGMICTATEFHPFAACLMFKGCHDGEKVRANLAALAASPAPQATGDAFPALRALTEALLTHADDYYLWRQINAAVKVMAERGCSPPVPWPDADFEPNLAALSPAKRVAEPHKLVSDRDYLRIFDEGRHGSDKPCGILRGIRAVIAAYEDAAPLARVPLTEDEISDITDRLEEKPTSIAHALHDDIVALVRAIEAAHGIAAPSTPGAEVES